MPDTLGLLVPDAIDVGRTFDFFMCLERPLS
jgi:hypothetical protein